jgi:hypothetical protein
MPDWIGPKEIGRILEATDGLGLHREAVRVPLDAEGAGRTAIEGGRLVITAPSDGSFDAFVAGLAERIRELPGVERLKRA